jgi:hypothetical protein
VTAIDFNVGAETVNVAESLIVPDVAVMLALPCATAVANPVVLFTVATEVFDEVQVAVVVKFCVDPSV